VLAAIIVKGMSTVEYDRSGDVLVSVDGMAVANLTGKNPRAGTAAYRFIALAHPSGSDARLVPRLAGRRKNHRHVRRAPSALRPRLVERGGRP
jgi:hypothetical protein